MEGGIANALTLTGAVGTVAAGAVNVLRIEHGTSRTLDGAMYSGGVQVATADYARAPAIGAPTNTLRIGNATTGANGLPDNIAAVILYDRVLTAAESVAVEAYLAKYTGQSALTTLAPTMYFDLSAKRSYEVDTGNAELGDQFDTIYDLSGNAHDAIQTTDSKQGTKSSIDGNVAVDVDGAGDWYSVGAGIGWDAAATDHTFMAAVSVDDAAGTFDILMDTQTGRLALCSTTGFAGQAGIYDGGSVSVGAATAGDQVLTWLCDATLNTFEVYRNGVFVGAGAYATPVAFGAAVAWLSNYVGGANFDGKAGFGWHKADTAVVSGADLFALNSAVQSRFSTTWPADLAPLCVPGHQAFIDPGDATTIIGLAVVLRASDKSRTSKPVTNANDASAWTPVNVTTPDANTLRETVANNFHRVEQVITALTKLAAFSVDMEADGRDWCLLQTLGAATATCFFQLTGGGAIGTETNCSAAIEELTDEGTPGRYRCTICPDIALAAGTTLRAGCATGDGGSFYVGDVTKGVKFYNAKLLQGNAARQLTAANRPTHSQANDTLEFVAASSQYLDWVVPNAAAGTLWIWAKFTDVGAAHALVGSNDGVDSLWIQSTAAAGIRTYFGGTFYAHSTATVGTANWHFVAVTWDGTNVITYVDAIAGESNATADTASTRAMVVGARDLNGVLGNYHNGSIGECGLLDRAATAAEIAYIRACTLRT